MSFWSETLERPNYMVAGKFVGEVEHVQHAYTWTLLAKILAIASLKRKNGRDIQGEEEGLRF